MAKLKLGIRIAIGADRGKILLSFIVIDPGRDSRATAAVGQERESVVDTREKLAGIVSGGFKVLRRNSRGAAKKNTSQAAPRHS